MVVIPPLSGVIQPLEPLYRVTMPNLPIYRGEIRGRRGEAAGTEAGAPPIAFHVACVPAAGEACKVSPDCIHIFIGVGPSQFEVLGMDLNELGASPGGETELSDGGISVVDESGVLEFVYSYELSC